MKQGSLLEFIKLLRSPPTRGRGLKLKTMTMFPSLSVVAPHAGAWIETMRQVDSALPFVGRPPRGGVD